MRTKGEQIEENNRDFISSIFSSMTLNELFNHYVKMHTKWKKVKKEISENHTSIWDNNLYDLQMQIYPLEKNVKHKFRILTSKYRRID